MEETGRYKNFNKDNSWSVQKPVGSISNRGWVRGTWWLLCESELKAEPSF